MARATLKLKRPITQFELDLDENSLEAVGFIRMSKAKTNADRIRAMTDEELAETMLDCFAAFYDVEWSKQDILDWLKQEASE